MRGHFIAAAGTSMLIFVFCIFGYMGSFAQCNADTKKRNLFLLADPAKISDYINNYRGRFCRGQDKKHTRSIYMDTTYFNFIADYFADHPNPDYDGIRIYFASYNKFLDSNCTHQAKKKQITLLMVPTIKREAKFEEFKKHAEKKTRFFDAVNHGELCPNSCDNVTESFTNVSKVENAKRTMRSPLIFLEPEDAKEYVRNYRRKYCFLWNKKHTRSLWLNRENFRFLKDFFDSENKGVPKYAGVRIFFAGYNRMIGETKNRKKKQITLIFTAALDDDFHNPKFEAFCEFYSAHQSEYFKNDDHGELSPKADTNNSF